MSSADPLSDLARARCGPTPHVHRRGQPGLSVLFARLEKFGGCSEAEWRVVDSDGVLDSLPDPVDPR
eukprot:CAMPEP_0185189500 /NCGR_PEP_ID=MMETSP1140-20130426/6083_1 /TAXON_ID=298111 /ORGANISM="Pavlova sp., Strain CCMP459" /LENGTH=66 /DNA_ID=CAMNT_0027756067 /DNA_START=91 /DNA_END=287 /DNA_ORIENTATION=-